MTVTVEAVDPDAEQALPPRAQQQLTLLTVVLVSVTFGQRLALPLGSTAQVPLALPVGVLALVYGLQRRLLVLDRDRSLLGLIAACVVSLAALVSLGSGASISLKSYAYLILTYLPFAAAITGDLGAQVLERLVKRFLALMVALAFITIGELVVQPLGFKHPQPLERVVPSKLLLTGYNTTYPFSYLSPWYKSNGVFFLEPSFCSQFLALAIIAHLWLGRRTMFAPILFGGAIVCTLAGTGFVLLLAGLIPLFVSGKLRVGPLIPGVLVAVVVAVVSPVGKILLSRAHEGRGGDTSTGQRFFQPFSTLGAHWVDGGLSIFFGAGPGTSQRWLDEHYGNGAQIVPLVPLKMLFEYGLVATLPFLLFVLWSSIAGARSAPITSGLVVAYLLLSGSLLQPAIVFPLWLLTGACARSAQPLRLLSPSLRLRDRLPRRRREPADGSHRSHPPRPAVP